MQRSRGGTLTGAAELCARPVERPCGPHWAHARAGRAPLRASTRRLPPHHTQAKSVQRFPSRAAARPNPVAASAPSLLPPSLLPQARGSPLAASALPSLGGADGLVHRAVPPGVSGESRTSTMRPSPRARGAPPHPQRDSSRALQPVPHLLPKMLGQREEDGSRHPPGECRGQQLPHGAQHGVHPLPARLITPRPYRDRYGDEASTKVLIPPGERGLMERGCTAAVLASSSTGAQTPSPGQATPRESASGRSPPLARLRERPALRGGLFRTASSSSWLGRRLREIPRTLDQA